MTHYNISFKFQEIRILHFKPQSTFIFAILEIRNEFQFELFMRCNYGLILGTT